MNWRRQHRWSSLLSGIFLLPLCLSGILLNHRDAVSDIEISRTLLPPHYRYKAWNGGLMRGTIQMPDSTIAIYGANGVWRLDTASAKLTDYSRGLPSPAGLRNIRAMAVASDSSILALTPAALYRRRTAESGWMEIMTGKKDDEIFSDLCVKGDSVILVSRSRIFISQDTALIFSPVALPAPKGYILKDSLFKKVLYLHSGQLFGPIGIAVADVTGIILIILLVTGFAIWLRPFYLRHRHPANQLTVKILKKTSLTHRQAGLRTIPFTLLICITGWALRPPFLIALALTRTDAPVAENPWHDRLRMVRYDRQSAHWILHTSEGLFVFEKFGHSPLRSASQPPVSVMGLNVWEEIAPGEWLCGSFSGAFRWDSSSGEITDFFTGVSSDNVTPIPFGKNAVSGASFHFGEKPVIAGYTTGTDRIAMPDSLSLLPMPLWNVALEIHSGRIFFGTSATYFFIFIIGGVAIWSLISGLKLMMPRHKKSRSS